MVIMINDDFGYWWFYQRYQSDYWMLLVILVNLQNKLHKLIQGIDDTFLFKPPEGRGRVYWKTDWVLVIPRILGCTKQT